MWFEPGRFIVGELKQSSLMLPRLNKKINIIIGVDIGMNVLIRPALYGSYHEIVNLTKYNHKLTNQVSIVGSICESGDKLVKNRAFPDTDEGDVILIANAGAYVSSMSSDYNLLRKPKELII